MYQHGAFAISEMPHDMEKVNSDGTLQVTVLARSRRSARDQLDVKKTSLRLG